MSASCRHRADSVVLSGLRLRQRWHLRWSQSDTCSLPEELNGSTTLSPLDGAASPHIGHGMTRGWLPLPVWPASGHRNWKSDERIQAESRPVHGGSDEPCFQQGMYLRRQLFIHLSMVSKPKTSQTGKRGVHIWQVRRLLPGRHPVYRPKGHDIKSEDGTPVRMDVADGFQASGKYLGTSRLGRRIRLYLPYLSFFQIELISR